MQDAVVLNNGLGPQVQTLLSMLGLQQEERVVHPRVRDIDSRYNSDDGDNIKIHDHYIKNFQRVCFDKETVRIFRSRIGRIQALLANQAVHAICIPTT